MELLNEKDRLIEIIGRRGLRRILKTIKDNGKIILSDMLELDIGHGTALNRREDLLNLKLICEEREKIGKRTYTFYKLTPKGEKILSLLEEIIKTLEEDE